MYKYIPRDQNLVFSFWIFLWMFGQVYCCYELTWHSICVSGRGQKCGVESLSCRKVLRIELNFPRICVSIYKCWSVWPVLKRIDNATQTWWMPFSLSLLFLFFIFGNIRDWIWELRHETQALLRWAILSTNQRF